MMYMRNSIYYPRFSCSCKLVSHDKSKPRKSSRGQTGGGGRMPSAPKPALSLPPKLIRSKKGKSAGFDGTGLNFPFHNTKRGALGSPRTRSSFKPLSTCQMQQNKQVYQQSTSDTELHQVIGHCPEISYY